MPFTLIYDAILCSNAIFAVKKITIADLMNLRNLYLWSDVGICVQLWIKEIKLPFFKRKTFAIVIALVFIKYNSLCYIPTISVVYWLQFYYLEFRIIWLHYFWVNFLLILKTVDILSWFQGKVQWCQDTTVIWKFARSVIHDLFNHS